jgi:hypothetical protein
MKLIDYLQSPNGIRMTTFVASSIILIAFCHRLLKRVKKVYALAPPVEYNLLTARDCFTIISRLIESSRDMDELKPVMKQIETFKRKKFRFNISRSERRTYYDSLLILYCQKELELETPIAVELCKN